MNYIIPKPAALMKMTFNFSLLLFKRIPGEVSTFAKTFLKVGRLRPGEFGWTFFKERRYAFLEVG